MFIFWLLWPYIVARVTREMHFKYTGKDMPKSQVKVLRGNLAAIRPRSHEER